MRRGSCRWRGGGDPRGAYRAEAQPRRIARFAESLESAATHWAPGLNVRWSWAEVTALHAERMRRLETLRLNAAPEKYLTSRRPARGGEQSSPGLVVSANAVFAEGLDGGAAQAAVCELPLETMRIQPD